VVSQEDYGVVIRM